MTKHDHTPAGAPPARPTRPARLHRLLFAGAALGTTLLMLGMTMEPKLPRLAGE